MIGNEEKCFCSMHRFEKCYLVNVMYSDFDITKKGLLKFLNVIGRA